MGCPAIVICNLCWHNIATTKNCSLCEGRDRTPIPMSELFEPDKWPARSCDAPKNPCYWCRNYTSWTLDDHDD